MALVLSTQARNAAVDGVTALVNTGGAGKLKIRAADTTLLCTITLNNPAFGAASGGSATASGLPLSGTGAAGAGSGTAATNYEVTDHADTVVWTGTIPSQMTLDNVSIANGQTVNVTSWTHGQPAS